MGCAYWAGLVATTIIFTTSFGSLFSRQEQGFWQKKPFK